MVMTFPLFSFLFSFLFFFFYIILLGLSRIISPFGLEFPRSSIFHFSFYFILDFVSFGQV